jgi:hypothetical protein
MEAMHPGPLLMPPNRLTPLELRATLLLHPLTLVIAPLRVVKVRIANLHHRSELLRLSLHRRRHHKRSCQQTSRHHLRNHRLYVCAPHNYLPGPAIYLSMPSTP